MTTDPMPPAGQRALLRALLDLIALAAVPGGEPAPAERLATAGTEALGADAAVVLIVDDAGSPHLWAGSDDAARALGDVEIAAGDGPALDCCRAGQPLAVPLHAPAADWPGWTRAATERGWVLAEAVPLRLADRTVGALVLLMGAGRVRPEGDQLRAGLLAAATAGAIIQHRALRDLQRRADQLQLALTTRIVIEQAKGMLAERGGLDVPTAFDRLRRYARAHRLRLADVAEDVVTGTAADAVLTHVRPLKGPPSILDP